VPPARLTELELELTRVCSDLAAILDKLEKLAAVSCP